MRGEGLLDGYQEEGVAAEGVWGMGRCKVRRREGVMERGAEEGVSRISYGGRGSGKSY